MTQRNKIINSVVDDKIKKQSSNILNACSINPQLEPHSQLDNFRLIFAAYNTAECELHMLNKARAKKLIGRLSEITTLNPKCLSSSGWYKPAIKSDPKYQALIKSIPHDVDLFHKEFGGAARIFYYIAANFFCIVTIAVRHH